MTPEQLLDKQEREMKEFAAAQVRAWQELKDKHEREGLSGNDHYKDYQLRRQKELERFTKEWGSEGTHATALKKRHENERMKLSGASFPREPAARNETQTQSNERNRKRGWRR